MILFFLLYFQDQRELESSTMDTQHLPEGIFTEILSKSLKLLEFKICSRHTAVAGVPGSHCSPSSALLDSQTMET